MKTVINNSNDKLDLIEHINQDYSDDIEVVVIVYTSIQTIAAAYLADIFEEGVDIDVENNGSVETIFIPFDVEGIYRKNYSTLYILQW